MKKMADSRVRTIQEDLLRQCLAPWPRRGKTLLEVNCGAGNFLPMLWECGFDVTGTESSLELRKEARSLAGRMAEVEAAEDAHLPFADDYFDWVVLHLADTRQEAGISIQEAFRVALRGLAVTFWNSFSLPFLLQRLPGRGRDFPHPFYKWWHVWRQLKKLHAGTVTCRSAFPLFTGYGRRAAGVAPACPCPLPLGAWVVLRMDMGRPQPVTPLQLRISRGSLHGPEPVMEYGQRRISNRRMEE